jgi:hypothetical protein
MGLTNTMKRRKKKARRAGSQARAVLETAMPTLMNSAAPSITIARSRRLRKKSGRAVKQGQQGRRFCLIETPLARYVRSTMRAK